MKVWIFCSAAHFSTECADIMDVEVFATEREAMEYFENVIAEHTSEEGGWSVFSKRERHCQLTDGDEEYVAYVTEKEI